MDKLENAQKRSEYWKNESMAGTQEINELKIQIAMLRTALAGLVGAFSGFFPGFAGARCCGGAARPLFACLFVLISLAPNGRPVFRVS